MRLGLIARADSRGLGVQTKSVHDNLHPCKTLVVDCPSAKPLPLRMDWYPDATWVHGLPTAGDFRHWLQDLDVVYTAETGYGTALWDEAERAGVKTVLHANWEFLDRRDRPTLWAAPSLWHFDEFPEPRLHLPVPIDRDRFPERRYATEQTATRFLHVVGRPAIHDRNGSEDLIAALQYVTADVTVTFRCQEPGYVEPRLVGAQIPDNVKVVVESGDVKDNTDLYLDQDVLVLPRRFGGLCLPCLEAIGSGMPVIMPRISPQHEWLPSRWLVPASAAGSFMAKNRVELFTVDHEALARLIDRFATEPRFYADTRFEAYRLAGDLSWANMRDTYIKTFEELL